MKKLHALAFYALITPAIALGSTALLADHHGGEDKDMGEQDMGDHAQPEDQDSKLHEESTKSKYNKNGQTDSEMEVKTDDQSGMKKKDDMKSSMDSDE